MAPSSQELEPPGNPVRFTPGSGVGPLEWTRSSDCVDHLPGDLILELRGAEIAEGGVEPARVVDLLDEAGKVVGNVVEGLECHWVDGFDLEHLHEALGLGVVVWVAA